MNDYEVEFIPDYLIDDGKAYVSPKTESVVINHFKNVKKLEKQIEILKECVEFYACDTQYRENDPYGVLWKDRGYKARTTLEQINEMERGK